MTSLSKDFTQRTNIRQRATMRQVAALAGVGLKTVSRVINEEPNVSEATIRKVQAAAKQLDYRPDFQAGNMRRSDRRTHTLGLLVGSVANPFYGMIHRAVEDEAMARGTAVFASSLDEEAVRERGIVETFLRRRVDSLILTTATETQAYLFPEFERGTPMVFIDREPIGLEADSVVSDNVNGAAQATRHLLERGHRRIAFLGDKKNIWTEKQRHRGFLQELGKAGVSTGLATMIEDLNDEEAARRRVLEMMSGEDPPSAIFSSQNLITVGTVRALREINASHRVALIGFDDFLLADALSPAVSVVAQDPYRIGQLAAQRVFERLEGDNSPARSEVVPTRLIARGSGEIRAIEA
ncbi:LacI family DNA-binding transcriptional regulator [Psychromicrobium sp. YIM B11713]|uniref:LacI family DNA-binding transcriptional regulator n=1 Tax=Psychromicrobium sp. YIM B11713 TaxID=3145233 RepID=UPI00374F2E8A